MYYSVETDHIIDAEKERTFAEKAIITDNFSFKWDYIKGSLLLRSSNIELENTTYNIKANFYDNFDLEYPVLNLNIQGIETKLEISDNTFEILIDKTGSFIGSINELVKDHLNKK